MSKVLKSLSVTLFAATMGAGAQAQSTDLRIAARDSYIFTYPLVMMYRTMYLQAIEEGSPSYAGGMGEWLHLGVASPEDNDIVTPNNDTPYSYAWVDLRAEPWVLTMPEIGADRFYTSQWDDLWGYVLDNAGSVNDGNDGVSVMLVVPGWEGDLPEGIDRVIQGETSFLGTLTRTQVLGSDQPSDLDRIQQRYVLEPLSAFLGQPAPQQAETIDWLGWEEGAEFELGYWTHAARLLPLVERLDVDTEAYSALAMLGIESGQPFDIEGLDDTQKATLQAGIDDARALLAAQAGQLTDGTKLFGPRSAVGQRYLDRALGVYVGIFGNTKDVSVYLNRVVDDQGHPLDGSKASYEMTFAKGELPPVDFFWSMTMYRLPERLLVANAIDRFSIGSATPGVVTADDGSLTLYISAEPPKPEARSNWLPAPDGPFWMVLRNYGPGESILDRTYDLPPVRIIE
ncbi:DUF1254 domain-containing protein [Sulfitobacter sp. SK012]|uniref:DUF1254 domain-containing protein n=1 Tax=Sulfitobacter sp. SK012 TaxID=1389005 RepID=UPI0013B3B83E|nr:DUF1214 domain-containing protein [Sulfitobacter sp. SK012]